MLPRWSPGAGYETGRGAGRDVGVPNPGVTPPADAPFRPGGVRAGLTALGVFAVAQLVMLPVSGLVLALFVLADPDALAGDRLPPWPLLALLVVPASVGALTAVAGTALAGRGPRAGRVRRELALRWDWSALGTGLVLGLGGLLLTVPAAWAWAAWVGDDRAGSVVGDAFAGRQLGLLPAAVAFLAVWLVAPLVEEVLFRGVLWRALEHWGWNRWVVFAVTTAVFSVAHLELLRTPLLVVLSIPIGLARLVTGNVLAGVVAHQVNNFLPAAGIFLATSGVVG
ncbi:CPBP family intramembrane glutamic endopeptidase [Saccharothrix algeriensis]|uniref:Membrane protease YdiL (CAAX protease family) n=2 Tax=Saccharothrix algeriensis TaxID=173560 RepID=A0ABS2SGN0_9PSEU|nr:CPBP family intramembrane glutamic endopeptidase [Saccharothrix algeriensis]MBM7814784.1 membrane protease YdiL (CAAX protease family) [Saccharothrix algeriensis]